jgi:hypothetical protein
MPAVNEELDVEIEAGSEIRPSLASEELRVVPANMVQELPPTNSIVVFMLVMTVRYDRVVVVAAEFIPSSRIICTRDADFNQLIQVVADGSHNCCVANVLGKRVIVSIRDIRVHQPLRLSETHAASAS